MLKARHSQGSDFEQGEGIGRKDIIKTLEKQRERGKERGGERTAEMDSRRGRWRQSEKHRCGGAAAWVQADGVISGWVLH